MIQAHNVTHAFDSNEVLSSVSFSLDRGQCLVVLGKNGCGKSVLLKIIAGLLQPQSGTVHINGIEHTEFYRVRDSGRAGSTDAVRVGYVFQKGGLFDSMTVFDNAAFGLRRMRTSEDTLKETVMQTLSRVGLAGNEEKIPSELSGGMQKRVGLARAVCTDPAVLLYDDPTAGLDPVLSDSIADLMNDIRARLNTASIVVTHDLAVARKVADRIVLLYRGAFVFSGTADEFFSRENGYARQFIDGDINGPIDMF